MSDVGELKIARPVENTDHPDAPRRRRSTSDRPRVRHAGGRRATNRTTRIELDDPTPSLPVRERLVRRERLHGALLDRSERAKKYQRLKSLSQRRQKIPEVFAALDRREETDEQERAALRAQRMRLTRATAATVLERRREEYLDPSAVVALTPRAQDRLVTQQLSIRTVSAAVLASLALVFLIALVADLVPARHERAVVANRTRNARVAMHPRAGIVRVVPIVGIRSKPAVAPRAGGRVAFHPVRSAGASVHPVEHPLIAFALPPALQSPALEPLRKPAAAPLTAPTQAFRHAAAPTSVFSTIFGESPSTSLPVSEPVRHVPVVAHLAQGEALGQWRLSADGRWTAVVRAPSGMHDVRFSVAHGDVLPLETSASGREGAIIRSSAPHRVVVAMTSPNGAARYTIPASGGGSASLDVTAEAIGPHLVALGWNKLADSPDIVGYKIYRSTGEGEPNQMLAEVSTDQTTYRDTSVDAASRYRYVVAADNGNADIHANSELVNTPAELPTADVNLLAGKGMFLYFSALSGDQHYFGHYDPAAVIAEAQRAGIRVLELRMARGASFMAETAESRAWLNQLIDAADSAGIKLVAWTVPRRVTTEDLVQSISSAEYTTPNGNGFMGLALDLESGARYMGDGRQARQAMVRYIAAVRDAVGPRYLLIATVASPMMGHLTNADYPYAGIAQYADVMQPMEYWHYYDEAAHHDYEHREVAGAAEATVLRTRALAGRDIPVDIAGQSVDLEGTGAPSADEISWSLGAAKSVGALGETFFDWAGTQPDGWAAIQAFDW